MKQWCYLWFIAIGLNSLFAKEVGLEELCQGIATNYADIVFASYEDSLNGAVELQKTIKAFAEDPTVDAMEQAKSAWVKSRQPYLQTEAYRFYGGPIDDDDGPEPMINSWPIDEFYIDYVRDNPNAGIINDTNTYPEITKQLILDLNEKAGETTITCGYHAIEFLLWGQDWNDAGPGNRPLTDYTTGPNAERRLRFLVLCSDLLVEHLQLMVDEWRPKTEGNYRHKFLTQDPRKSVWLALYGMKSMAGVELAGERLLVAWDTRAQEDEHSCFSDTTDQDVIYDAIGLQNVFSGTYIRTDKTKVSGLGIRDVVRYFDEAIHENLEKVVNGAVGAARAIPSPFDQAILGDDNDPGRKAILHCVELLEDQATYLAQVEQRMLVEMRKPAKR